MAEHTCDGGVELLVVGGRAPVERFEAPEEVFEIRGGGLELTPVRTRRLHRGQRAAGAAIIRTGAKGQGLK